MTTRNKSSPESRGIVRVRPGRDIPSRVISSHLIPSWNFLINNHIRSDHHITKNNISALSEFPSSTRTELLSAITNKVLVESGGTHRLLSMTEENPEIEVYVGDKKYAYFGLAVRLSHLDATVKKLQEIYPQATLMVEPSERGDLEARLAIAERITNTLTVNHFPIDRSRWEQQLNGEH
jgi:hypothetical protein